MKNALWILVLCGAIIGVARLCWGAAPPNADPGLAPWFQSLQRPDDGGSCCDVADCRQVDYRTAGDHYEVWIDKKDFPVVESVWVPVPSDKILKRADNPTGRAIVCFTPAMGVMCFVKASQA